MLYFSLIANGDLISPVVRLLIPRKTLNHWDHILEMVTGKVTIRSGAVHRYQEAEYFQDIFDTCRYDFYNSIGRYKGSFLLHGKFHYKKIKIHVEVTKWNILTPSNLQVSFQLLSENANNSTCFNCYFLIKYLVGRHFKIQ